MYISKHYLRLHEFVVHVNLLSISLTILEKMFMIRCEAYFKSTLCNQRLLCPVTQTHILVHVRGITHISMHVCGITHISICVCLTIEPKACDVIFFDLEKKIPTHVQQELHNLRKLR